MENNKRFALITGATSGIGLELAKLFARDKSNLILVARNEQKLNATAEIFKKDGIEVITISTDLFFPGNALEVYRQVSALSLEVEVLVNDAGQGVYGKFIDNELERELDIIQLNISSLVTLTKLFAKDMVSRGSGKILNVASVASKAPGQRLLCIPSMRLYATN